MQPKIEGNLVVSRSAGVELPRDLTQLAVEERLDRHVDVLFVGQIERSDPLGFPELEQSLAQREHIRLRHDALPAEHADMGQAAQEILPHQRPVLGQRAGEGQHLGREPAAAGGVGAGDHVRRCNAELRASGNPSSSMNPSAAR